MIGLTPVFMPGLKILIAYNHQLDLKLSSSIQKLNFFVTKMIIKKYGVDVIETPSIPLRYRQCIEPLYQNP